MSGSRCAGLAVKHLDREPFGDLQSLILPVVNEQSEATRDDLHAILTHQRGPARNSWNMEFRVDAAFNEGARAYTSGVSRQANPYSSPTANSRLQAMMEAGWTLGWLHAFNDHAMAEHRRERSAKDPLRRIGEDAFGQWHPTSQACRLGLHPRPSRAL